MKKLSNIDAKICIKNYDQMMEFMKISKHLTEAERFLDAISKTIKANKKKL